MVALAGEVRMIQMKDQAVQRKLASIDRRLVQDHQREERKLETRMKKAGFMERLRIQQEVEMVKA